MNILLVNKYLMPKGGAETYVFELGRQLETMGHRVEYFGMDNPARIVGNRAGAYVKAIDFHNSSIWDKLGDPFHIIYSVPARRQIRKVLQDFQPDIVHLNNFNYQLTPSILYEIRRYRRRTGRRVKFVLTAHDLQLLCPNHMMYNPLTHENCEKCAKGKYASCIRGKCIHGSRLRSVLGALEGWLYHKLDTYRLIDLAVYPSRFIAEKMNQKPELKKNCVVLPNFVNAGLSAQALNTVEKQDYVLYFGRYSDEKGLATLVAACRALPHISFRFAGSGPLEPLFEGVDNIQNVGFQSGGALRSLVQKARFSVIPSEWYENCPFSVIESIVYHTPVIGARIGGIPELIQENKTGLLFESKNAQDLQDKISFLWEHPALLAEMTAHCQKAVFPSAEAYCRDLIREYAKLLEETDGPAPGSR